MRPSLIMTRPFRTRPFRPRPGTVPGHGPAGRLWRSCCVFGSLAGPLEEADQVAVLIQRRELAGAEIRLADPLAPHRMEHVVPAQLRVEVVHALDEDAAARRPRDERLGAGADGRLPQRPAFPPALVARLPQVDARVVPSEHREALMLVQDLEAEPVAVERARGGRVAHR